MQTTPELVKADKVHLQFLMVPAHAFTPRQAAASLRQSQLLRAIGNMHGNRPMARDTPG